MYLCILIFKDREGSLYLRRNVCCLSKNSPKPTALVAQDDSLVDGINHKTALSVKICFP